MAKISKAQNEAAKRYQARNPEQTRYVQMRRQARGFVNPKPGTVASGVIEGYGAPFYLDDLRDLKIAIEKRIEELTK